MVPDPMPAPAITDPASGAGHGGPEPPAGTASLGDAQPRSRRAILAAAIGSVVGAAATALGRPSPASAAPGDALVAGQDNFAGGAATRLFATSSGGAFWMTQYGFGSAIRGDSVNGHAAVFETQHGDRFGVTASNTAAGGAGAAMRAVGGSNHGLTASTSTFNRNAIRATTSAAEPGAVAIYGEVSNTAALQSSAGVSGVNKGNGNISGVGVFGSHNGAGYGVQGYAINGYGVFGSSTGGPAAIHGLMTSSGGLGVEGIGNGQFGSGVHGSSIGTSGHGVSGYASSASGTASGIYGIGTDPGFAGYFDGKVSVTGTFTSPAAVSELDHPLDAAGKVLAHAAVQSSELKTVYDGTVTTDAAGRAIVQLPAWFEALNGDVRYQLTVVGGPAHAWIAAKVAGGRFAIATSEPGVEVCWQVTGVRRDAYATAHPLTIERAKVGRERGRYLHPAEHGQPASAGVDHATRERLRERAAATAREVAKPGPG